MGSPWSVASRAPQAAWARDRADGRSTTGAARSGRSACVVLDRFALSGRHLGETFCLVLPATSWTMRANASMILSRASMKAAGLKLCAIRSFTLVFSSDWRTSGQFRRAMSGLWSGSVTKVAPSRSSFPWSLAGRLRWPPTPLAQYQRAPSCQVMGRQGAAQPTRLCGTA